MHRLNYLILLLFIQFLGFTIELSAQSIILPKNNQVFSDTLISVVWDESAGVDYYNLQVSTDSSFQSIILDSNNISTNSAQDNNIGLYLNRSVNPYFCRIRFNSNSQYSNWSAPVKFFVFDPNLLDSLVLWLAADTGIVKDANQKVSQWSDFSGLNHNASQINSSVQPVFQDSAYLNKPSVSFSGGNYVISGAYASMKPGNKYRTSFFLFDISPINYSTAFVNFNWNVASYKFYETTFYPTRIRLWLGNSNTYLLKNLYGSYSGINLTTIAITNSNVVAYVNSVYSSQAQYNLFVDSVDYYAIGGRTSNGQSVSSPFTGQVFEIIDYAKPLDSAEIQLVNKYLLDKYTPPVNLGPNILRRYGFCDTVLQTEAMYESYLWSTGDTTRTISISKEDTGWYWCEVPNLFGDIMRDSVYVYDLLPKQQFTDTTICLGDTLHRFSVFPDSSYNFIWRKLSSGDTLSTTSALQYASFYEGGTTEVISLKISDTLSCFRTDTFTIFIDSFPDEASLGPDTSLCTGDKIGLVTGQTQADTFLWNTGSTDSLLVIQTPGTYSLRVADTLGCVAKDTINVAIHGITPYVNFFADTVCLRDTTLLIDSSKSLDQSNLIAWTWQFGDGTDSSHFSPLTSHLSHVYPDSGQYTVKLTVTTDSNCTNYKYKNIYIRPLPEPDFYPLTACQNLELAFQNLTQHTDTIINWQWNFGDGGLSGAEAPTHIYAQAGNYPVLLKATDPYGCQDSISKNIEIRPAPDALFAASSVCEGSAVSFADQSQTQPYNPVMSYEWNFDPNAGTPPISTAPSPKYTFAGAGYFPVSLKVTTLNGCWDTITTPVQVHAFPQAAYAVQNACMNAAARFFDSSTVANDSIVAWYWNFDHGWQTSTLQEPKVVFKDTLNHHMSLRVRSNAGCEDSIASAFKIYPSPRAAFTVDREYGLPPLTVNFDNQSVSNTAQPKLDNYWVFGDGGISTQESPTHIYTDSNIFYPQLTVENIFACRASVSHPVYVVYAAVDISLSSIVSSIDKGFARFSCVVENRGKQKVKSITFSAAYNGGTPIQEDWSGELLPGQKMNYVFRAQVKVDGSPAYFCIEAEPHNDLADESPADNKLCKEYNTETWIGAPFPNPADHQIQLDIILPVNADIDIQISTNGGKRVQNKTIPGRRGLNQLKLNLTGYASGTYYLRIETPDATEIRKFVVL